MQESSLASVVSYRLLGGVPRTKLPAPAMSKDRAIYEKSFHSKNFSIRNQYLFVQKKNGQSDKCF